jgi:hypothetical protein
MPMKIAILEDNEERRIAMQARLSEKFRQFEIKIFDDPAQMICFLREYLQDTILISLDHDLELRSDGQGRFIDPGSGRTVADFLTGETPACPVVIHTTNSDAAVGMEMALQDADWETYRVVPSDDLEWIERDWLRTIRRAILATARPAK